MEDVYSQLAQASTPDEVRSVLDRTGAEISVPDKKMENPRQDKHEDPMSTYPEGYSEEEDEYAGRRSPEDRGKMISIIVGKMKGDEDAGG